MTICVSRPQADSFSGHAKNVTFLPLTDKQLRFSVSNLLKLRTFKTLVAQITKIAHVVIYFI